EEEAVAREVHATHARIVSGPDPEPMQEDQTGSNSGKLQLSFGELGKSISLTEAEEEVVVAREVHATHARIVSESEPELTQRRQSGIAFRDSFIVSKKSKGIQTLTPAKQEAADIMKALKESKKMSKRQPGIGGSNEGTGNILGVPDEEKLILEWEVDCGQ
ncbi:hypothetical protein Tco_0114087, partial [Tanacetum coccineum]